MQLIPARTLTGPRDLQIFTQIEGVDVRSLGFGIVRVAKGVRSPESGFHVSAQHVFVYVLAGRFRAYATDATEYEIEAGTFAMMSPAVAHALVALEDTEFFYVQANRTADP